MQIDLFTLLVQIINFLILLFVLNKLVYKPLIKAMKDRNKQIQDRIDDADSKLKEAELIRIKYNEEMENIENYRIEELNKIKNELEKYKNEEIKNIKDELEVKKESFKKQLKNEEDLIVHELFKKFFFNFEFFFNDVFKSISNSSLNSVILSIFLDEIKDISTKVIEKINSSNIDTIDFISSYDITKDDEILVKNLFNDIGFNFKNINFIEDKDLILGNKVKIGSIVINSNMQNIINNFNIKLKSTL